MKNKLTLSGATLEKGLPVIIKKQDCSDGIIPRQKSRVYHMGGADHAEIGCMVLYQNEKKKVLVYFERKQLLLDNVRYCNEYTPHY